MAKLSIKAGIELLSLIGMLVCLAIPLMFYRQLPDSIAVHFGVYGQPNGWGPKGILWFISAIATLTYLMMTFAGKVKRGNDPKSLAKAKAAEPMLLWLRFEIAWLLAYIELMMVRVSLRQAEGLGIWFLPIYLVVILGTVTTGIFKITLALKDGNTKPPNEK